jgi:hypothetical protein
MDLVEKYIGEGKGEFVHVYNDKNDEYEWTVVHSVHSVPRMGGQTIKNFKTKEKAQKFAEQMAKKWKATLAKWTKEGHGAGAKYISDK